MKVRTEYSSHEEGEPEIAVTLEILDTEDLGQHIVEMQHLFSQRVVLDMLDALCLEYGEDKIEELVTGYINKQSKETHSE